LTPKKLQKTHTQLVYNTLKEVGLRTNGSPADQNDMIAAHPLAKRPCTPVILAQTVLNQSFTPWAGG
jgi:hypothetical protein